MNEFEKVCKEIEDYGNRAYEKGQLDILDKIRAEIEFEVDHRTNMLCAEDVFEIIDKYKAESDHKCHNCKHYTSGEYDGSCDSYICEHYSNWEASDKE